MSNLVEASLAKTSGVLGIGDVIFGLGNVICGFVWLGHNGYGGHGLWSGFGLIFAGMLGITIWRNRSKILMIFFLVTSIILVIVLIVQAAMAALAYIFWSLFQAAANCYVRYGVCHCFNSEGEPTPIELETCDLISLIDGLFLAMTIFSSIGTLLALAGSVIGCMGTCCTRNQAPGMVMIQQPSGTQSTVAYTTHTTPLQYPPEQYPAQQYPQYPAVPPGQHPPPQYSAPGQMSHPATEAIPPKA